MSLITMMIGFWDLYKNVPILSDLIQRYLNSMYEFFEAHVSIRMSMLLGLIISKSSPFIEMINYIFKPGVFSVIVKFIEPIFSILSMLLYELYMPFVITYNIVATSIRLILDLIAPVIYFLLEMLKIKWSLVKLILYLPSISIVKLCLMVKETLMGILFVFK